MLHSSTNSLFPLKAAIWLHGRVYLTTRYHQTSPLPHSASFLPKHNQLIRSTREMRLVCKALKATFGKSQRPIISGKPTETPYCMGHRAMAKFPRGSTWPPRRDSRTVTNRFRQSRAIQSMPLINVRDNNKTRLSMLRYPGLSSPEPPYVFHY